MDNNHMDTQEQENHTDTQELENLKMDNHMDNQDLDNNKTESENEGENEDDAHERRTIHSRNPQSLIEKILRERIYEATYWKEKLFGLNAEALVDRAVELTSVGGQFANQKPTDFVCLALKMLQLQPSHEMVVLFLEQTHFKYLTALAALYVRLAYTHADVYRMLEPFLLDKRKLRRRTNAGSYDLTFMDAFVDELLTADRACDTILPRLTKRYLLEDQGLLEPRISPIEHELDLEQDSNDDSSSETNVHDNSTYPHNGGGKTGSSTESKKKVEEEVEEEEGAYNSEDERTTKPKKVWSKKKVGALFKSEPIYRSTQGADTQEQQSNTKKSGQKEDDNSMTIDETNRIRASLGLKPLQK